MRLRLPLLAVATAGLLLGGCTAAAPDDGVSSDPAATNAATGAAATPSCGLASAAVVKSGLNLPVGEPMTTADGTRILCNYVPTSGDRTLIVRFETGRDKASFARAREGFDSTGQPTTDVTGLFDEAYLMRDEFDDAVTNTLVARKGSVEMLVAAVASVEAEKALVTKVMASVG